MEGMEGLLESTLPDEAAACFAQAALRMAAAFPEAGDECTDPGLKKELFPIAADHGARLELRRPSVSVRRGSVCATAGGGVARLASGRRGSIVGGGGGAEVLPSPPPPTLTACLMRAERREEALALVECVHSVGVHAHRTGMLARAAAHYDFAARLAERVVLAGRSLGGSLLARAECAAAFATLNRGRLLWASGGGDVNNALADFGTAAAAFERALSLLSKPAAQLAAAPSEPPPSGPTATPAMPTSEGVVRTGAALAYFSLGVAQEAIAAAAQIQSGAGAAPPRLGRRASIKATAAGAARGAAGGAASTATGTGPGGTGGGRLVSAARENPMASCDALQCFSQALSFDGSLTAARVALASMLLRRHRPREALSHLTHPSMSALPLATINRAVIMHHLDSSHDGAAAALAELDKALAELPTSVVAAFNRAQLQMHLGGWCHPLAALQRLSALRPKRVGSPMAAADGTPEAERAAIAADLDALLDACRKWQACLEIASNDFRTCATLLQPHIPFDAPCRDALFHHSPPQTPPDAVREARPASAGASFRSGGSDSFHSSASVEGSEVPLSAAQLALLETLIATAPSLQGGAGGTSTARPDTPTSDAPEGDFAAEGADRSADSALRGGLDRPNGAAVSTGAGAAAATGAEADTGAAGLQGIPHMASSRPQLGNAEAPATALPAEVSSALLIRALALQRKGKMQQAERMLEAALRPLMPPASRALGATGALLYLWRSRTRLAVGKAAEAREDLSVALAHVGAEGAEPPPAARAAAIAAADEGMAAESTAAAVAALARLRREAVLRAELAAVDAESAAAVAEAAAEGRSTVDAATTRALASAKAEEAEEAATAASAASSSDALNASEAAAAAAAVVVPRAAWWACGLLLEEGASLEAAGDLPEALRRYTAAISWQPLHVVANANAARLLEAVDNDQLRATVAYVNIAQSSASARRHAASAAEMLLDEDDDADEATALREAAACAMEITRELGVMRNLLQTGFAQRPPEDGPPSEEPLARQQGRLAIAMDQERHRQALEHERQLGMELSAPAAEAVRRKRVLEATTLGGALLGALAEQPLRLFDTKDGGLTLMLWGVEKSTARLQAAMSRGAKAIDRAAGTAAPEPRPATAMAGGRTSLPPAATRPPSQPKELMDKLLHWGDPDGAVGEELETPLTDRLIHDIRTRQVCS